MDEIINKLEYKVMNGQSLCYDEAILLSNTDNAKELYAAADRIRDKFRGKKVDLCSIMNAKSGKCSENCKYCAQSGHYNTGVEEYPLIDLETALKMAKENEKAGAHRFALVTSGGMLSSKDFDRIIEIFEVLRRETSLHLCASLGKISYEQAVTLKRVGVSMYHHNLETSRSYFTQICDTHTYEDKIDTIRNVIDAGLPICSGGIIGLGETMKDRIDMACELKSLGVKSVPINILNPIQGTPLEKAKRLAPEEILKTISVFRFIIPDGFIRYAGGRNALGELQTLGFKAGVNAALVGNYLTTVGKNIQEDIQTIRELGLDV